jgi:hypothetical protein
MSTTMAYVTNKICRTEPIDPFLHPLDAILADIAIAVQLPPGLRSKARDRYEAVRTFAEREGSPLRGHILRFFAQGSMAIDATTSTRGTDDEYDLDIVAELAVEPIAPPDTVLDLLFRSIKGYPTSQKVIRQTRCVTVRYADKMHLNITPAARLPNGAERESHIFHANPAESPRLHFHVPMNAYGFALWYQGRTPQERWFAHAFDERLRKAYSYEIHADAEVDDVPGQVPLFIKSVTTVALQLLKRFRNVAYASSEGRIPPSAMMSWFAGHAAQPGLSLSEMVIRQARLIASSIRQAGARREKIMIVNPIFQRDCFTDRWPESLLQQEEFAAKLTALADGLEYFKQHEADLETLQVWLREHFGGYVVSSAIRRFNLRNGRAVQNGSPAYTHRGGLYVPSAPVLVGTGLALASRAVAATPHTFRGDQR